MTLGFGVITRNQDADGLRNLLKTVKGVDAIYITVADIKEPTDEIKEIAKEYNAHLSFFEWIDDFAAARNFNMSHCKEDWYVWGDTDDEIEGLELSKSLLEKIPAHVKYLLCTYNYAFFPSGEVENAHPKERFIKMNENFEWKGALHENCITDHKVDGILVKDIIWHHRSTSERAEESCYRNIRIVEKELENQIETLGEENVDPRTVFNLGMAYSSYAQKTDKDEDWEESIKAFYKYLSVGGWDQHAFLAWRFIGNAHIRLERPNLAIQAFFECLKIAPQYKDAYASLGAAYLHLNDKDRAKHWFKLSLIAGEENTYVSDRRTTLQMPIISLAEIYAQEGKIEEAEQFLKFGIDELKLEDEFMSKMLEEIQTIKAFLESATAKVEELNALPEEEQKAAFDALEPKLKSAPALVEYRRKKKWFAEPSGKDLVIHTGIGWEPWTPENEKTGIGGSEEAVINLARALQKRGWNVKVYGNHGFERKVYDGVEYIPYWEWSPLEPTNVFIAWRDPTLIDTEPKADVRYVWLHDTNPESSFTKTRLERTDKIIVLSKYHRALFPNIPDSKFFLSSNGLRPEHFTNEVERDMNKCMFMSAPNRGLLTALQMWPKVREQVPDATLYWAYGWDTYDIMMKTNPQARVYKEKCLEMMKQPGVVDLGRIGHEEIARHMQESNVWFYPTEFTEIFPVHGDTLIETAKGRKKIKHLAGKEDVYVYSLNEKTKKIELSKMEWCGLTRKNADVLKIKMKYGIGRNAKRTCELTLTPDHPVMMRDGSWKHAKDIEAGDRVMPMNRVKNGWGEGYDLLVAGYAHTEAAHRVACRYHTKSLEGLDVDHIDGNTKNNNPDNLQALSRSDHWKETWDRKSSKEQKAWKKIVTNNLHRWHKSLGDEISNVKRAAVNARWAKELGDNHVVLSVEEAGKADVYCMEVEPNHNFVANSVVVHNCIGAIKAQAAGMVPVTTNVAALDETVQYGEKFDVADIYSNKEAQDAFVERTVEILKNGYDKRDEMIDWSVKTWSWEAVADKWSEEFNSML